MSRLIDDLVRRYPDQVGCREDIAAAARLLIRTFEAGNKLLVCGSGGSAADAGHIAGELMKGCVLTRPLADRDRQRIEDLGGGVIADRLQGRCQRHRRVHGFCSRSIRLRAGDVLWGLSTSGNAENVWAALLVANARGKPTIGLTGAGGGRMALLCTVLIRVPYTSTQDVQERHLPIYHTLCLMVEEELFG